MRPGGGGTQLALAKLYRQRTARMDPTPTRTAMPPPVIARSPDATARAASPGPPLGPEDHIPTPCDLSFNEVLQALNPLQHLPVVGTIYRAVSGETLNPALRILGGAALGGPIGLLTTAVITAIEELGKASQATATAATQGSGAHG